jgi:hypothetical protein
MEKKCNFLEALTDKHYLHNIWILEETQFATIKVNQMSDVKLQTNGNEMWQSM